MAERIIVDPITRIEGHMRVEVEVAGGTLQVSSKSNKSVSMCTLLSDPKVGLVPTLVTAEYSTWRSTIARVVYTPRRGTAACLVAVRLAVGASRPRPRPKPRLTTPSMRCGRPSRRAASGGQWE